MLCDHCGDCYELLTDVSVLNALANLLGDPPCPPSTSAHDGVPPAINARNIFEILT